MLTRNESYVIHKEPCPKCRELGNDRSGDNLACYSDGHQYCFRCGYMAGRRTLATSVPRVSATIALPADVTTQLPVEARAWLGQYSLGRLDLQQNHIMWSEKWSRIIFPYFDDTGLIAWQGRYVGTDKNAAKWFSQGKIHEIIHPIKVVKRQAILVEDIVSAIKVSRFCGAIPIFGSSISQQHMLRLKILVDRVWYWLDKDVQSKVVKLNQMSNLLGLESRIIITDKDPKKYKDTEIEEILKRSLHSEYINQLLGME